MSVYNPVLTIETNFFLSEMNLFLLTVWSLATVILHSYAVPYCHFEKPKGVTTSAVGCKILCNSDPDCTHYEYETIQYYQWKNQVKCFLFKAVPSIQPSEAMGCGFRDNWQVKHNATVGQKCLFVEDYYTTTTASSAEECLSSCVNDVSCTHFNYYSDVRMDNTNASQCRLLQGGHQGKSGVINVSNGLPVQCGYLDSRQSSADKTFANSKDDIGGSQLEYWLTNFAFVLVGIIVPPGIYLWYTALQFVLNRCVLSCKVLRSKETTNV